MSSFNSNRNYNSNSNSNSNANNNIIEIRKATNADADSILELVRDSFKTYVELAGINEKNSLAALNETTADIENDIQTKYVFVATKNSNDVVGTVRVEIHPDKTAYLSRFAVKTNYQKSGIGTKLIESVDALMKKSGVKKLCLHSASKITPLICFYYNNGFYVDSTNKDKGYIRALLCKDYIF